MDFIDKHKRLEYLLEMIEKGRCLSVKEVAEKFDCSESTVKRLFAKLREQGHLITYCKTTKKMIKEF